MYWYVIWYDFITFYVLSSKFPNQIKSFVSFTSFISVFSEKYEASLRYVATCLRGWCLWCVVDLCVLAAVWKGTPVFQKVCVWYLHIEFMLNLILVYACKRGNSHVSPRWFDCKVLNIMVLWSISSSLSDSTPPQFYPRNSVCWNSMGIVWCGIVSHPRSRADIGIVLVLGHRYCGSYLGQSQVGTY